jgi:hypothetical protein
VIAPDAPYASDHPADVRGPWRAVLSTTDDRTVGMQRWMADDGSWATQDAPLAVAIVRGTAMPMDEDDDGVGLMPNAYHPGDVLYRHDDLAGDEAEARWAQARLVAALLNANQQKLDELEEWNSRAGSPRPVAHPYRNTRGALQCQGCGDEVAALTGDGLCTDCDNIWAADTTAIA